MIKLIALVLATLTVSNVCLAEQKTCTAYKLDNEHTYYVEPVCNICQHIVSVEQERSVIEGAKQLLAGQLEALKDELANPIHNRWILHDLYEEINFLRSTIAANSAALANDVRLIKSFKANKKNPDVVCVSCLQSPCQ